MLNYDEEPLSPEENKCPDCRWKRLLTSENPDYLSPCTRPAPHLPEKFVRHDCPCFYPVGEPTEEEMLNKAIEMANGLIDELNEIGRELGCYSNMPHWSRSTICEAIRGGKDV